MKRTFADFFAGIGLAHMGIAAAGWKACFANDIDRNKRDMYRANFKRGPYLVCDIHEIAAPTVPDVSLWWASFPCTDVSLAGYRAGLAGSQTGALLGVLRLLREKDGQRPPIVVLENVTGFISSHKGEDFDETIRQMNGIGYACDAFILDAVHFVPQSRPRLFIVAVYDQPDTKDVRHALCQRDSALKSPRLTTFMTEDRDLRWAVHAIPPPPRAGARLSSIVNRLPISSPYWWSEDRVQYLLNQMSERHGAVVTFLRNQPKVNYATAYRRMRKGKSMAELRADGIAGCLRTPRGGSSRQILIAAGKGDIRARFMTPRECARLMGAPQYRIDVPDNQAYFGFGDAVCVPAVKWIAQQVLNPLVEALASPEYASTTG